MHDFKVKLAQSETAEVRQLVEQALRKRFPEFLRLHRAAPENDRVGIDYLAEFPGGVIRFVEVKQRNKDWLDINEQDADLALETWSDIDTRKVGWVRDPDKLTDFLVFVWTDSGRSLVLDYRLLRGWFTDHWEELKLKYPPLINSSKGRSKWRSETIFVPHRVVVRELAYWSGFVPEPSGTRSGRKTSTQTNSGAERARQAQNAL